MELYVFLCNLHFFFLQNYVLRFNHADGQSGIKKVSRARTSSYFQRAWRVLGTKKAELANSETLSRSHWKLIFNQGLHCVGPKEISFHGQVGYDSETGFWNWIWIEVWLHVIGMIRDVWTLGIITRIVHAVHWIFISNFISEGSNSMLKNCLGSLWYRQLRLGGITLKK